MVNSLPARRRVLEEDWNVISGIRIGPVDPVDSHAVIPEPISWIASRGFPRHVRLPPLPTSLAA
jgi:hypothetical protein